MSDFFMQLAAEFLSEVALHPILVGQYSVPSVPARRFGLRFFMALSLPVRRLIARLRFDGGAERLQPRASEKVVCARRAARCWV